MSKAMDHVAYTAFADSPELRQKIVEVIMQYGKTTNAQALNIAAGLYSEGFKISPYRDKLTDAIAQHGQIPHMTQR